MTDNKQTTAKELMEYMAALYDYIDVYGRPQQHHLDKLVRLVDKCRGEIDE